MDYHNVYGYRCFDKFFHAMVIMSPYLGYAYNDFCQNHSNWLNNSKLIFKKTSVKIHQSICMHYEYLIFLPKVLLSKLCTGQLMIIISNFEIFHNAFYKIFLICFYCSFSINLFFWIYRYVMFFKSKGLILIGK